MTNIVRLAAYFGIGAILHAFCIGPHFDWSSAWTWAWLFAWPVMLIIWFWILIVIIVAIVLVIVGILALLGKL